MLKYKGLFIFNLFSNCMINSLAITYGNSSTFDSYVIYNIFNPIFLIFFATLGGTSGQIINLLSGLYLTKIATKSNHIKQFQINVFNKYKYYFFTIFVYLMTTGWIGALIIFVSPYFIKIRIKIFIFSAILGNIIFYILRWQKIKFALNF